MTSTTLKIATAALTLLAAPLAVSAADMPIKGRPYYKSLPTAVSYYDWTGFYAGVNGGYGFGTSDWSSPAISPRPRGILGGGQVGYNLQVGSFVYGIEGDAIYSDASDDVACGAGTCTTENRWLATVRGRVGYAFDRFLPYFTGGVAFGEVRASNSNPGFGSASDTRTGYVLGGGLEYAFSGNWSAKVEYQYVDLGRFDCGTSCGVAASTVDFQTNIVKVGLNYRFGGSPLFSRF